METELTCEEDCPFRGIAELLSTDKTKRKHELRAAVVRTFRPQRTRFLTRGTRCQETIADLRRERDELLALVASLNEELGRGRPSRPTTEVRRNLNGVHDIVDFDAHNVSALWNKPSRVPSP